MPSAIKKISIENKDFFVFSEFLEETGLTVYLFKNDLSESYMGFSNESDLRRIAAEARFSFNNFCEETLCALSLDNPKNLQFVYNLEKSKGVYTFKWKRILEEGVVITLGYMQVDIQECSNIFSSFLTKLSVSIYELNTNIKTTNDELCNIMKENNKLECTVEEAVKVKEKLEEKMYAKFLMVLNNKKRKIRELYEKIELLENNGKNLSKPTNGKTALKLNEPSTSKCNELSTKHKSPSNVKRTSNPFASDEDDVDEPVTKLCRPRRRKQEVEVKVSKILKNCDKTVVESELPLKVNTNTFDETIDGLLDFL